MNLNKTFFIRTEHENPPANPANRALSSVSFNLTRFDLLSIRLAVSCAQHGSLTVAARECNIALAAASRRIKELEAGLGLPSPTAHREAETAKAHRG